MSRGKRLSALPGHFCSFRVDEVLQRGYSGLVVDLVTPGGLLPAGSRDHSFA